MFHLNQILLLLRIYLEVALQVDVRFHLYLELKFNFTATKQVVGLSDVCSMKLHSVSQSGLKKDLNLIKDVE
jgi:hypothetical protein